MTTTRAVKRRHTAVPEAAAPTQRSARRPGTPAAAMGALARRAGNRASNEVLEMGGAPLEPGLRDTMEQRFGTDFTGVQVHADADAADRAEARQALAFTQGSDIYFGAGSYHPETAEGRTLVAHELAHVIQQTKNTGPAGSPAGLEAEAQAAASGPAPVVGGSASAGVAQRATKDKQLPPVMPEAENLELAPAGSGHALREFALNVDEAQAVGEAGISEQESMRRAMDLKGRQFLDQSTNSATKGALKELANREPLPPTSVKENPSALISRPTLGGVKEWDELSDLIMEKVKHRLPGKTPGQVKEIINEAIRDEIKNPTTGPGKVISDALSEQMNTPAEELFQGKTVRKQRWSGSGSGSGKSAAAEKTPPPAAKKTIGKAPANAAADKAAPPAEKAAPPAKKTIGKRPANAAADKAAPPAEKLAPPAKKTIGKRPANAAADKAAPPAEKLAPPAKKTIGKRPANAAADKAAPPAEKLAPPAKKTIGKRPANAAADKAAPPAEKAAPPAKKTIGKAPAKSAAQAAAPPAPAMEVAEAVSKGIIAPVDPAVAGSQEGARGAIRVKAGGGSGGAAVHSETAAKTIAAPAEVATGGKTANVVADPVVKSQVKTSTAKTVKPVGPVSPGTVWAIALMAYSWIFPEDVAKLGEWEVDVAGPAIGEAHSAVAALVSEPQDPTEAFVQKVLKSGEEPGQGIQEVMARHGWRYDGLEDGAPVWTQAPYYRNVKLIVR